MPAPTLVRAGPSGKRLGPVNAVGQTRWNAASPLILELAAAGHTPGVYRFTICSSPIVLAGSGTLTIGITFDAPGVGPVSMNFSTAGAINSGFRAPRNIVSSGRAAIVMTLTPAAITGSPIVYINCPLDFILATFPSDYPA